MPVAVNVPVAADEVAESPLPPQETKVAPAQANKRDAIYFYISKTL